MKFRIFIFFVFTMFFMHASAWAQCDNSISITSKISNPTELGSISVEIKSDASFNCTLLIETADNTIAISEEKGRGNKTIRFADLKKNVLYTVWVHFPNSKDFVCSSLRKSVFLK